MPSIIKRYLFRTFLLVHAQLGGVLPYSHFHDMLLTVGYIYYYYYTTNYLEDPAEHHYWDHFYRKRPTADHDELNNLACGKCKFYIYKIKKNWYIFIAFSPSLLINYLNKVSTMMYPVFLFFYNCS